MNSEDADKKNKVNEPDMTYKPKIMLFKSFEEQEEYEMEQLARQDPVKCLKDTVELILRAYGFTRETLSKRKTSGKIKIIRRP